MILAEAYRLWSSGRLSETKADLSILRTFDRGALTGQLGSLFERLTVEASLPTSE